MLMIKMNCKLDKRVYLKYSSNKKSKHTIFFSVENNNTKCSIDCKNLNFKYKT